MILLGSVASGHGGPTPPPPTGSVPISLNLLDTVNTFVSPVVTVGVCLDDLRVPSGGSIVLYDSSDTLIPVQQDEEAAVYTSGSINRATLSFVASETFTPSSIKNYKFAGSATPPDRTPVVGWSASGTYEDTLAANSDFKIVYTDYDNANVYTVSLNTILSTYNELPSWGTSNPVGGWQRTATGPIAMEWRARQYLINDSSHVPEGYRACTIYLKAWSPTGPFEISFITESFNAGNAINNTSERWGVSPPRFAYTAVVKNGGSVIANVGGPSDTRAVTIPNANFDTTNNIVTGAFNGVLTSWNGAAVAFASGGSLPSGISANTTYFPGWRNGSNSGMALLTQRGYAQHWNTSGSDPNWAPSTAYNLQQFEKNGALTYVCVTAGTSASSGGPSGTGTNIVDGTAHWANINVDLTSQGSGTITMFPIYVSYQGTGVLHCDKTMERWWVGTGTRPQIVGGQDVTHLFTQSKALPAYVPNITVSPPTGITVPDYNPMYPPVGFWFLNTTGEGPGDNRIGLINEDALNALYQPSSKPYYYTAMNMALAWASTWNNLIDERGGQPYVGNNGPARNGTAYPNLPTPQPTFNTPPFKATAFGTGNWLPFSTAIADVAANYDAFSNNQWITDTSHMPRPWYAMYLKTGRRELWDIGARQAAWVGTTYPNRAQTDTTSTVRYIINQTTQGGQLRGAAWAIPILQFARWVCPSYEPIQPYFVDLCKDNAAYQKDFYTNTVQSAQRTFGIPTAANHLFPGTIAPWMYNFLIQGVATWTWQGIETDWGTQLDFMRAWWNAFIGNGVYALSTYDLYYGSKDAENTHANFAFCYQTQQDFLGTAGLQNYNVVGEVGATGTGSISGTTLMISGVVGTVTPGSSGVADICTGSGVTASTKILSQLTGTSGKDGTYQVSISQTVASTAMTINSGTIYVSNTNGNVMYDWAAVSGTGIPSSLSWRRGTSTGGVGTMVLRNSNGSADITQGSYFRAVSTTINAQMNNSGLPAWFPVQPWMTDFGNNLHPNFPYYCNWYGNAARFAMKMHCLARPADTALATQLANLTNTISTLALGSNGGINWSGTSGGVVQNHPNFAIY